jgi:hypothetical protein
MMARSWLLVVAGLALVHGFSASTVDAQAAKKSGQLDLQLAVVEEQLAELEQFPGDPRQLAEYRLKRLLERTTLRDYQDLKRSIEMLEGKRFKDLENRQQLIEEAKQKLEIYETVIRYQEGKIPLEHVRKLLLPVIEGGARQFIESGALAAERAALERRRSDLLKIQAAAAASAGDR